MDTSLGPQPPEPVRRLRDAGVAIWLDDLSRQMVRTGELARLTRERAVVGVTSNPTIFAKALAGHGYDDQLTALAAEGADVDAAVLRITTDDVREACDVLAPVHEQTDGLDGRVSIEVDPRLANDTEGTIRAARQLWATVARPNLFVKIPATRAGLPAITAATAEGISVNVTLIFALERYREVIEAYRVGLDQARATGRELPASVASFFVSRVDTAVDARLDARPEPAAAALRGQIAIANARLAYQVHEQSLTEPAWQQLLSAGARPQRPLWASTGVKDPAYPDTRYVDRLVTPGVVNTMPLATLEAVADHGQVQQPDSYQEAASRLAALADLGIDLTEVTDELEADGVAKFVASWAELRDTVDRGLAAAR